MRDKYNKREVRRKSHGAIKVVLSLTLAAIVAVVILGAVYLTDPRHKLIGKWTNDIDVTSEVRERASAWIKAAAMGGEVDTSEYITDVCIPEVLTFTSDGNYTKAVDEDAYSKCRDTAYEQMAAAFVKLIGLRFEAAGRQTSEADIEALMQNVTGMTVKDYLIQFGPDIMPPVSELQAKYNRSGIYMADRQTVLLDNELLMDYMVSRRMLALDAGETETNESGESEESSDSGDSSGDMLSGGMMYTRVGSAAKVSYTSIFAPMGLIQDLSHVSAANVKNRILENLPVSVSGGRSGKVKTIHYDYLNNRFVSLRDMALLLKGTDAEYSVSISSSEINIVRGASYSAVGGEDVLFAVRDTDNSETTDTDENKDPGQDDSLHNSDTPDAPDASDTTDTPDAGASDAPDSSPDSDEDSKYIYETNSLKFNKITVDGKEVKYCTVTGTNSAGKSDAYISITDIAMILDVDMTIEQDGLHVDPGKPFAADIDELKNAGFYTEVRSALVGDATTGEVYASYCDDVAVSIASTTKLMNLLCVMDAISSGEISLDDRVVTSLKASLLSKTGDGVVPMNEGDSFTVEELIYGMMLPSSNECALMLAEHISGSEEAYVERMNNKAVEIGLSDKAKFYNPHGLPVYSDNLVTTKLQNQMTASDMFALVSYMLAVYPQITDITSTREYTISSKDMKIVNLNPMLYNLDDCVGLKTGTTNMAGASLVSAVRAKDGVGNDHVIVSVEFGAEDAVTRNTVSELMLRYGLSVLADRGISSDSSQAKLPNGADIPITAEGMIRLLLEVKHGD